MKCPNCGEELMPGTRDAAHCYKGKSVIIKMVCGLFCPSCGEAVLEEDEAARISREMLEFNKQVDANDNR